MSTHISALLKSSASAFVIASAIVTAANAGALPGHGRFTDGRGSIARNGNGRLTVDQNSQMGIVDWRNFSVGKANSVVFHNGNGATLNIVHGDNLSRVAGQLHGTGSVYLINRSGVVVTGSGRIDTQGSFIASGRNADSFSDNRRLTLHGHNSGTIVNRGTIHSANGNVGLFANTVRNTGTGTITSSRNAAIVASGRARVNGSVTAAHRVETSGSRVGFTGLSVVAHNWLIDPKNLKVTSSAASTISSNLASSNVTLKTTSSSCSGPGTCSSGGGDITIAGNISWSSTRTLTLNAYRSVIVNNSIHAKGKGNLTIGTAHGGDLMFGNNGSVTFDNLASNLTINGDNYTLENSISGLKSAVAAHPGKNFALTKNLDLGGHTYSAAPISPSSTGAYHGTFEGLGHTISKFKALDQANAYVGLFGYLDSGGSLRDITMMKANVTGLADNAYVGTLLGFGNTSTILAGVHASGTIACGDTTCGGIAGNADDITNAAASVNVGAGSGYAGGLAGYVSGEVSDAHASGNVQGLNGSVGGLLGYATGDVSNSYATGDVMGNNGYVAGLAGYAGASVKNSYAKGDVTGGSGDIGGLAGYVVGNVSGSHATGDVSGSNGYVAGLAGYVGGAGGVSNSHATGKVVGGDGAIGGLAGYVVGNVSNSYVQAKVRGGSGEVAGLAAYVAGNITHSYVKGDVIGASGDIGGLAGYVVGNVSNSYFQGNMRGTDGDVGGLLGYLGGDLSGSHVTGDVMGHNGDAGGLGGFVGGGISNSYFDGSVHAGDGDVGGVAGYVSGSISTSYATGDVSGGSGVVGGLAGSVGGKIMKSHAAGDVSGLTEVGGLVGSVGAGITRSYATGDVSGGNNDVGGLAGSVLGTVSHSHATGDVRGGTVNTGGLTGSSTGITSSFATGDVTATSGQIGGLTGTASGDITLSHASGDVRATGSGSYLGGLVAYTTGSITKSHATGDVFAGSASATSNVFAGGLTGYQAGGQISQSYANGNVSAGASDTTDSYYVYIGGLTGYLTSSGKILHSHATGGVSAGIASRAGGLFGFAGSGTVVKYSFASGDIRTNGSDSNDYSRVGGLGGDSRGTVSLSYATGDVTDENTSSTFYSDVGGLLGYVYSSGTVSQSFATGKVTVAEHGNMGGLIGVNLGSVGNSYALGDVICGGTVDCRVGGFAGYNSNTISKSYSTGSVTGTLETGGFVGEDSAGTYTDDYWDTTTSGTSQAEGTGASLPIVGYTNSQMKGKSLSSLGFSGSIWKRSSGVNGGLPYLKNNPPS